MTRMSVDKSLEAKSTDAARITQEAIYEDEQSN